MNLKLAAKIVLAMMVCLALAGPFWSRVTLSLECIAVGLALAGLAARRPIFRIRTQSP
jgi:hypothetical protein